MTPTDENPAGAPAASRKKSVFYAGGSGCRWSGILDRHEAGLHHPNKRCKETQSDGAYFEHDRPRGRTITLVGNRKVSPIGHLDRPHLSAWRGDGAPPLFSRRVGRPARRTKALAATRGNTPKLAAPHFLRQEIGSPCIKTAGKNPNQTTVYGVRSNRAFLAKGPGKIEI
jgi:hypothetical protein